MTKDVHCGIFLNIYNIKLMSDQVGQAEVMTQPLHAVQEETSYDTRYVRKKEFKKLCSLVLKLCNKNNDKYYSLTKC